jgi:hypothetical protein
MTARAERLLVALIVACAPRSERETLSGDLLEAAAECRERGALAREALASLPALVAWRIRRLGPARLGVAALAAVVSAGVALGAVEALWHVVLSWVPRRAGHVMPAAWTWFAVALATEAGVLGAWLGARLVTILWGGRTS